MRSVVLVHRITRWIGAVVTGAVGLGAGDARAQAPTPATVLLVPPSCATAVPFAGDAFVSILTTELRADGVERLTVGGAASGDGASLAVIVLRAEPCDATARDVEVTIEDHATSKKVERRVQLGDASEAARPRALALAVAELLRATWLELATIDAPPPQVPVPEPVRAAIGRTAVRSLPSTPDLRASSPPPPERDVSIAVAGRFYPAASAALVGGRAAGAMPLAFAPSVAARIDFGALVGSANDPLGDINLGLATIGLALLVTSPRAAPVSIAVGPRVELGIGWASGNPVDQATSSYAGSGLVERGISCRQLPRPRGRSLALRAGARGWRHDHRDRSAGRRPPRHGDQGRHDRRDPGRGAATLKVGPRRSTWRPPPRAAPARAPSRRSRGRRRRRGAARPCRGRSRRSAPSRKSP